VATYKAPSSAEIGKRLIEIVFPKQSLSADRDSRVVLHRLNCAPLGHGRPGTLRTLRLARKLPNELTGDSIAALHRKRTQTQ
jgi:hypothetical protein